MVTAARQIQTAALQIQSATSAVNTANLIPGDGFTGGLNGTAGDIAGALFEAAGKPSPHPEAPVCGHYGDTSCTSGAMTEAMQFLNLTA